MATFLLASVQQTAVAGNLAYRFQLSLATGGPTGGIYWVSIPFGFSPEDSNSNLAVDAEDLVQSVQPAGLPYPCTAAAADCAVVRVWRWDEATGDYMAWTGGSDSGTPFDIEPGTAYGLEVQEVSGHTEHLISIVGVHDPAVALTDCYSSGGVNLRWLSLPPNLAVDTSYGIPDVLDAEDLGQAMGGPDKVFQIRYLDEATGRFESWVVGSAYGTPFEIDLRKAYAIDLSCTDLAGTCAQCPWSWEPPYR
jgi:hypothetical protein